MDNGKLYKIMLVLIIWLIHMQTGTTFSVLPTYLTSPLVQASSKNVISTLTASSVITTTTITFTTAFTGVPHLAYGLYCYESNDFMDEEKFSLSASAKTSSGFILTVDIFGTTSLWLINMRYIGIDPSFAYPIASFQNLQPNCCQGVLINITSMNSSYNKYTTIINYTSLAAAQGSTFTSFSEPLSNTKIALFITHLHEQATAQPPGSTSYNPLSLKISTTMLTTQTFSITIQYGLYAAISLIQFSMIAFDYAQIAASLVYELCYEVLYFGSSGGFVPVQLQWETNLLVGLLEFGADRTKSVMHFNLFLTAPNGIFGLLMPPSMPVLGNIPLQQFGFSLLYLKYWTCPTDTFYNITSKMCQSCQVINCLTCQNLKFCVLCNFPYFANLTGQCQPNSIVCGDNIYGPYEQCDDGNLINGDGCSNFCVIQKDFLCELIAIDLMPFSSCYYVGEIVMRLVYIDKIDYKNQIEIRMQVQPNQLDIWNHLDISQYLSLSSNSSTYLPSYTLQRNPDNTISIFASYRTDLCHIKIQIQLCLPIQNYLALQRQPALISNAIMLISDDNEPILFYEQEIYRLALDVAKIGYVVGGLGIFMLGLGIFKGRLIALEVLAVVQLTWICLIGLKYLNPTFKAFSLLYFVHGVSLSNFIPHQNLHDTKIPKKLKGVNLYTQLFWNYNIMGLLFCLLLFCGLVCFVVAAILTFRKRSRNDKIDKEIRSEQQNFCKQLCVAKKFLGWGIMFVADYVFALLIFSGFIISLSLFLQMKYQFCNQSPQTQPQSISPQSQTQTLLTNNSKTASYIEFGLLLLVYMIYFVLKIVKPQYFGQFNDYFCINKFDKVAAVAKRGRDKDGDADNASSGGDSALGFNKRDQDNQKFTQSFILMSPKFLSLTSKIWYNIVFLQKFIISMVLVLMMDNNYCFLPSIVLEIIVIILIIVKKPYNQSRHNYRAVINSVTQVSILSIFLYFNLSNNNETMYTEPSTEMYTSSSTPTNKKNIYIYLPLIISVMLLVCIVLNLLFLLYQWRESYMAYKISSNLQKNINNDQENYDYIRSLIPLSFYNDNSYNSRQNMYRSVNSSKSSNANISGAKADNSIQLISKQIDQENKTKQLKNEADEVQKQKQKQKIRQIKLLDKQARKNKKKNNQKTSENKDGNSNKKLNHKLKKITPRQKIGMDSDVKIQMDQIKKQLNKQVLKVKAKIYQNYQVDMSIISQNSKQYSQI